MASRTRRRPRVVWLPPDRTFRIGLGATLASRAFDPAGFSFDFGVPGGGPANNTATVLQAIVGDTPMSPATTGNLLNSLSDVESSGYRLRRIVGKLNIVCEGSASGANLDSGVLITAGFIVLRVDEFGEPIDNDPETYSVATFGGSMDPWIWRRSWLLGDKDSTTTRLPGANWQFGSVADGPHVDQKTARIVSSEERLFLVITGQNIAEFDTQGSWTITVVGEMRVLASMRSSSGNRRNASR